MSERFFESNTPFMSFFKGYTPDLGLPWEGSWKLDFGGCSGATAKLALKRQFGHVFEAGKGGSTTGTIFAFLSFLRVKYY